MKLYCGLILWCCKYSYFSKFNKLHTEHDLRLNRHYEITSFVPHITSSVFNGHIQLWGQTCGGGGGGKRSFQFKPGRGQKIGKNRKFNEPCFIEKWKLRNKSERSANSQRANIAVSPLSSPPGKFRGRETSLATRSEEKRLYSSVALKRLAKICLKICELRA